MLDSYDYQLIGVTLGAGKVKAPPMPPKEELLKRNSFGSVNDNKYLDKFLQEKAK